ncbi:hypothetical protein [Silvibacterium acidisoli]|uniref:hypothetical protein n=1 Tax=Acidobacteriaceae bacterium ZG23-2 TaxID=2883246 RepID=UPI00406CC184
MQIIVLVALLASIYQIKRYSVIDAVINVWLLCFLMLPEFYSLDIPHLPPLTFAGAALLPILFYIVIFELRKLKLTPADVLLAIFFLGEFYSEASHTTLQNAGLVLVASIRAGAGPYLIGRLIAEQPGVRERLTKRFVLLVLIVSVISVWEFRMGNNLFVSTLNHLFPNEAIFGNQLRGGHVRVAGPYMKAELAGMIFGPALLFAFWLRYVKKLEGDEKKYLRVRKSTIVMLAIAAALYMTISRGPLLGGILGWLIARIGTAKNMKLTAILTAILCIAGGTAGYVKAKAYTAGDLSSAKDQDQENAIYRRMLLDAYKPIVEKGGLFGYGIVNFPKAEGQASIDNHFLYLQVTQGKLGLWTFILLNADVMLMTLLSIRKFKQRIDICFALCIAGGIASILLTITTVYLGGPSYTMLFLLLGWGQSLRPTEVAGAVQAPEPTARFRFRRVIV